MLCTGLGPKCSRATFRVLVEPNEMVGLCVVFDVRTRGLIIADESGRGLECRRSVYKPTKAPTPKPRPRMIRAARVMALLRIAEPSRAPEAGLDGSGSRSSLLDGGIRPARALAAWRRALNHSSTSSLVFQMERR